MTSLEFTLSGVIVLLLAIVSVMGVVIRGAIRREVIDGETFKTLTGREIEQIRIKAITVGMNSITKHEVMNVIHTVRAIQLGTYEDKDPYIPADIYADVEDRVFTK